MKEIKTLWDILDNYGIEVPPIQRDYAQGRETVHVKKVRNKFLSALLYSLREKEKLHLDFVYGKINGLKNEEEHRRNKLALKSLLKNVSDYALSVDLRIPEVNIEDKSNDKTELIYLVPLDGQQRLTTLFLIHWYIAKRIGYQDGLEVLKRFRYKTRRSSTAFLKLLTASDSIFGFKDNLRLEITDLEFFSSSWLDDPTVDSMLVMLNEIHECLKEVKSDDLTKYWHRLVKDKVIWFDFLNLKDFNLSDELYVKMNARGKQLTPFENFKAWLVNELVKRKVITNENSKRYNHKIDIEWNDIFWNYKKEGEYRIDSVYFNFFKLLFFYDNVKRAKLNKNTFEDKTKEHAFIENVLKNKAFDWEETFGCNDFFENIPKYFNLLSICEKYEVRENQHLKELFNFVFSSDGLEPSWQKLLSNYITLAFIIHKNKSLSIYSKDDWDQLNSYQRVMFNMFNNSIMDNPKLYKNTMIQIDNLNTDFKKLDYDIDQWIETFEIDSLSSFSEHQVLEEVLKVRLLKDNDWKVLIFEAEENKYFNGQLNFWFFHIDTSIKKNDFDKNILSDKVKKDAFFKVSYKLNLLFKDGHLNRKDGFENYILERALLSGSDYLLSEKKYKCFCRGVGRDVSWKRLFLRDRNSSETNKTLKEIFNLDFDDVQTSFRNYISQNEPNYFKKRWRRVFIENHDLFEKIGNQRYIRKIENHGWVIIMDHYKTYIGAHYELYSLDLYLKSIEGKVFKPFTNSGYHSAPKNSKEDVPLTYINGWKYKNREYAINISYSYDSQLFFIKFFHKETDSYCQDMKRILGEHNFLLEGKHNFFYTHLADEKVVSELNILCDKLKDI
ncbi:GmrSD restriction endonuclease domain-containing protein [Brumimicrobium sp.]|uniref:GmrSD restriction endonuclease domain-containing protein n=1 Tax=Brumimicrobium sp. TaxID=2029867 RepID=UPI003A8D234A